MDGSVKRIPSGVSDFDSIIKGGIPVGSVILLMGDLGAGQQEYVLTSASKLSLVKENPSSSDYYLGHRVGQRLMPKKICYITFARSQEDILQEIKTSFNPDFYGAFERNVQFKDFSKQYFRNTMVPRSWTGETSEGLFSDEGEQNTLEALVDYLDNNAHDSMVIIDSLTDLVVNTGIDEMDMVAVLRGMQRMAKRWKGVIYLLLTKDIVDNRKEKLIMDSVDGALVFEWSKFVQSSRRQRYMYVEKFMSILPHLDQQRIARFATVVTAQNGLVVIDTERIG
jgi:KaiC/GvpD/RAD55 family RecA-like ATPase